MMNRVRSRSLFFLALFFWPLVLFSVANGGQDISATWLHDEAKDQDDTDEYFLTYTLDLKQEVTEAMSLQESIRYTSSWLDEQDTQSLNPSLRFQVTNDIFLLELFGAASQQRNSENADQERASVEAAWTSAWDKLFWPNVRTSIGGDWQEDDNDPKQTDKTSRNETLALDWNLKYFKTYYNYNHTVSENYVTDRENDTTSNFARLEADHNFLQNRLTFGFSQQFSETRDISTINLGTLSSVLVVQSFPQARITVNDPDHTDDGAEFTPAPLLNNDNLTDTPVSTNSPDEISIAIRTDFKTIDQLYFYTVTDQASVSASFTFDLYTSDDGISWQLHTTNLPNGYNSAERRFEFPIPALQHLWLKLVITGSPALPVVNFSEIDVFQLVTGENKVEDTTSTTSMITNLNLGAQLTDYLSLTYNLSIEDGEYGSGVEYDRYNQSGNLKWQTLPQLTTTVGINESESQNGDADETLSRSYTLNMDVIPLDTLDVNMGVTRAEEYQGSEKQAVNYNYGLFTTAALYPDLDASLDVNYSRATQELTNVTTKSYDVITSITARLVPKLTADFSVDYQHTLGDSGSETTGADLSLNWRASDMLSLNVTGNKEWIGSSPHNEGARLSLALAPTETTQFSISYIYSKSAETSDKPSQTTDKVTVFGSWSLGPHFTMQANGSYVESMGVEDWQVQSQLVARFSVL